MKHILILAALLVLSCASLSAQNDKIVVPAKPAGSITRSPFSTAADAGYETLVDDPACGPFYDVDLAFLFPEWRSVGERFAVGTELRDNGKLLGPSKPRESFEVLEGIVANVRDDAFLPPLCGPSFQDQPFAHFTHDFCFDVRPTSASQYLLACRPREGSPCAKLFDQILDLKKEIFGMARAKGSLTFNPAVFEEKQKRLVTLTAELNTKGCAPSFNCPETLDASVPNDNWEKQQLIEVEWETGLAQGNKGNPAAVANRKGDSFGFFSAGHKKGDLIWNWPTYGDFVHVEGLWIFDRGHPPARTEIHPPHFVSVQRTVLNKVFKAGSTKEFCYATRTDVYASGDGSPYWNNRPNQPAYVMPVNMRRKDYTFTIRHDVQPPLLPGGVKPKLVVVVEKRPGDTFSAFENAIEIKIAPPGKAFYEVEVTVKWKSKNVPNTAVLARTIRVYWEDFPSNGRAASYKISTYKVTLDKIKVLKTGDGDGGFGDWKAYANVGENWFFLNELVSLNGNNANDILETGISETPIGKEYLINKSFEVILPLPGLFRVYVSGWDNDDTDDKFGHIINHYDRGDSNIDIIGCKDFLLVASGFSRGVEDPLGEVNDEYSILTPGGIPGTYKKQSVGPVFIDPVTDDKHNPNGMFELSYRIVNIGK